MALRPLYCSQCHSKSTRLIARFVNVCCTHSGAFFSLDVSRNVFLCHGIQIFGVYLSFNIKFYALFIRGFLTRLSVRVLHLFPWYFSTLWFLEECPSFCIIIYLVSGLSLLEWYTYLFLGFQARFFSATEGKANYPCCFSGHRLGWNMTWAV